ncbi:MAG: FKBP-type peptidyl-prolyl cis-trans isomerase [Janthinobacterium lividum]
MRFSFPALAAATALLPLLASAQTTPGFQRTASGFEYKLFRRDAAGRYQPRPLTVATDSAYSTRAGRVLLAHVSTLTGRDSVLQSSRQQLHNHPAPVPLVPVARTGTPDEALALLLPGDSAVFRFSADSVFRGGQVPPMFKRGGNALVLQVAAVKVVTEATAKAMMQQMQQQMMAEQAGKDKALIADYLKKNNFEGTAKQTPGGTWYIITQRGTGALPQNGQTVSVKYRGTILETGKEFDSTAKHGDTAFDFPLGQGQVIKGWDQGIAMLPKGSTATLLIPSSLGYGPRAMGADIPANSALRFDVELVDIKGTATAAAPAKKPAVKKPMAKKPVAQKPVAKKPMTAGKK